MPELRPIGLFGGTFDPIHYGHLRLAEELREALRLVAVHFVPAGHPWQRSPTGAGPAQRLEMVRRAVAGNPRFVADGREVARSGPTYSIDSVLELRAEQPDGAICLLLGADAFLNLETWHRWDELLDLAHVGVAHRPGHELDRASMSPALGREFAARCTTDAGDLRRAHGGTIYPWPMTPLDISASRIRSLCGTGATPRYLLPDGVLDYIELQGLYPAEANET